VDYSGNIKILTWQGFFVGFNLWTPIMAIYFAKVTGSYVLGLSGLFLTLMGVAYAIGLNYSWLVAGAILEGLARALNSGNNDALLYDSLNKSDRKDELEKFMGYIGAAEQWASGLAAILGVTSVWLTWKLLKLFPATVKNLAGNAAEFTHKIV